MLTFTVVFQTCITIYKMTITVEQENNILKGFGWYCDLKFLKEKSNETQFKTSLTSPRRPSLSISSQTWASASAWRSGCSVWELPVQTDGAHHKLIICQLRTSGWWVDFSGHSAASDFWWNLHEDQVNFVLQLLSGCSSVTMAQLVCLWLFSLFCVQVKKILELSESFGRNAFWQLFLFLYCHISIYSVRVWVFLSPSWLWSVQAEGPTARCRLHSTAGSASWPGLQARTGSSCTHRARPCDPRSLVGGKIRRTDDGR